MGCDVVDCLTGRAVLDIRMGARAAGGAPGPRPVGKVRVPDAMTPVPARAPSGMRQPRVAPRRATEAAGLRRGVRSAKEAPARPTERAKREAGCHRSRRATRCRDRPSAVQKSLVAVATRYGVRAA